jgi:hypothetical protein
MLRLLGTLILTLVLSACGAETESPGSDDVDTIAIDDPAGPAAQAAAPTILAPGELIDSTIAPAVAGERMWEYYMSTDKDLTGDGEPERVVITARVEVLDRRPVWDDGQPWQVYVEAADGSRTYLYAQRLQLGTLTMRVTLSPEGGRPTLVLIEHLPDRLRVFEAAYDGADETSVALRFERRLDPVGDLASPQLPPFAATSQ